MINSYKHSSRGFFTIAQNTEYTDYLKLAYLQALNIKYTQKKINKYTVGITPGMMVPDKYKEVFDEIVEIPWEDEAIFEPWKLANEWKTYYMTPYDQTIKVESDLLFTQDISDWWYLLNRYDILPTIEVLDYRGNVSNTMHYRKELELLNLENFYSGLYFFKKSHVTSEFFNLSKDLYRNWYNGLDDLIYTDNKLQKQPATTDIVFSLASSILGLKYHSSMLKFVHMKKEILDVQSMELNENWMKSLKYNFNDNLDLFIENIKQIHPIHYHIKGFCSDNLISKYEKKIGI